LGITVYPPTVPVVALAVDGAKAEARKRGVNAKFAFAADAASQQSAVETLLGEGVKVLAIDPNDSTAITTAVKEANSRKIPVIMWVGTAAGGKVATTISSDELKGGKNIAQYIFKTFMRGSGDVAFVQGDETHSAFINREKGFRAVLARYRNIKLVALGIGNQTADQAYPVALDMITKNPQLKAIFADSDAMADGVYRAVVASGKAGQIGVFGYNGACQTLHSIWQGKITATLYQGWSGFGVTVVDTALKLYNTRSAPKTIVQPTYVIDKKAMSQIHNGRYAVKNASLTSAINAAIANRCPS
jgi:ribose transport system substrate-binding protein